MGVVHAGRDLNLHVVVLRNWVSQLAADPLRAFPGLEISPPAKAAARDVQIFRRDFLANFAARSSTALLS
jgi:hypothetical protein